MNYANFSKKLHELNLFDRFRGIALVHGTSLPEVHGRSRIAPAALARRKCMQILQGEPFKWTFSIIGEFFDGRDHSTVVHYLEKKEPEDPPPPPYSAAERRGLLDAYDAEIQKGATPELASRLASFSGPVGATPEMVTRFVRERGGDAMSVVFDWAAVERLSAAKDRGKLAESLPTLVRRAVDEFIARTEKGT